MVIDLKHILMGLITIAIVYQGYAFWSDRPVDTGVGITAPDEPLQLPIEHPTPISYKGYQLMPVASFVIQAKLHAKQPYRFDASAKLSPIDLGVGWGAMSDNAMTQSLKFSQSNRFFRFRYKETPPVPLDTILTSFTNIHVIPATSSIEKQVKALRVGSVIRLYGKLVNVSGDNFTWQTSTVRTDTGKGACEIMYVEAVEVLP